ncbi:MAG: DUF934 domain-containing protein [Myxococcota bacterium]|nr:DUF934 domain-containing protein [Myxococcota bacterium]
MKLIRRDADGARVEDDGWVAVPDEVTIPDEGDVIVSLDRWREGAAALRARSGRIGLRVPGDLPPEELAPQLDGVALVAIELPKFTDGRAYSLARLLRDRFAYEGELRAIGHVLRDQLLYLARCGFDTFVLAEGKSLEDGVAAFDDFTVEYQPAADHDTPIWRRRSP